MYEDKECRPLFVLELLVDYNVVECVAHLVRYVLDLDLLPNNVVLQNVNQLINQYYFSEPVFDQHVLYQLVDESTLRMHQLIKQ